MSEFTAIFATGFGTIGGIALMFRFLNGRINGKQNKDSCEIRHAGITEDLTEIKCDIKEFRHESTAQGKTLASIETMIKGMNGK